MEEKKEVTHSLHLEQRGHGLITGVTEMKSFDGNEPGYTGDQGKQPPCMPSGA